jgi:hypothetical protein
MGTAGSDYAELKRCLSSGLYANACAAARSLAVVPLADALDLTLLAAEKDPKRFEAMAVRWLSRLGTERSRSVQEMCWVMGCLKVVGEGRGEEAVTALRGWLAATPSERHAGH